MECENLFCIYWKDHRCSLGRISLDITRLCEDCIYISMREEDLLRARQKVLASLDKQ